MLIAGLVMLALAITLLILDLCFYAWGENRAFEGKRSNLPNNRNSHVSLMLRSDERR